MSGWAAPIDDELDDAEMTGAVFVHDHTCDESDRVYFVVLYVCAPWMILEHQGHAVGVEAARYDEAPRVALLTAEWQVRGDVAWTRAPAIQLSHVELDGNVWRADGWTLRPHPFWTTRAKKWERALNGIYGTLTLRLDRSAQQIRTWLHRNAPLAYLPIDDMRYRDTDGETDGLYGAQTIQIYDGMLMWSKSYKEPSSCAALMDAGLLNQQGRGCLGELTWDLVDGDWGGTVAAGDTCASLLEYLDVNADDERLE